MALVMDRPPSDPQYPVSEEVTKLMCNILLDQNLPISERFKALSLRSVIGSASRNALIAAMKDPSILLAYTAAFELGRMRDSAAIPGLEAALNDLSLHPIVRLKVAESLGCFTDKEVVPILQRSLASDPAKEVQETCEVALNRQYKLFIPSMCTNPTIFPRRASDCSIAELRDILLEEENNIYERHVALFALRRRDTEEAFSAIVKSLGSKSPIMRYGVVVVMSLLNTEKARGELSRILQDTNEHSLVRLEAANFFGDYDRVLDSDHIMLLKECTKDQDPVVAQSCEVGLARLEAIRLLRPYEMWPMLYCSERKYVMRTSAEKEKYLLDILLDQGQPTWERLRAFSICEISSPGVYNALIRAMWDTSTLLAYSVASSVACMSTFVGDAKFIPAFRAVLADLSLHPIVRHKAAEALGEIGLDICIPILRDSWDSDPAEEVRETCYLALRRIEEMKLASPLYLGNFRWGTPAAPACCSSIPMLRQILLDEGMCLYKRHSALFSLQRPDDSDEEVISTIIKALGVKSTLLRYWVTYTLTQMRSRRATDALCEVLVDTSEHPMVRQLAVRGLDSDTDDPVVIHLLEKFASDPEPMVSQRCELNLKMIEFKRSGKRFVHELDMKSVSAATAMLEDMEQMNSLTAMLEDMEQRNSVSSGHKKRRLTINRGVQDDC